MFNTDRLETLSDGIFAIAMTILVFNISMPDSGETSENVSRLLINETHTFFIFGLSFIILAMFWILHHKQFHYIEKTNKIHIWTNILFLMLISLMPFTASLIGDYPTNFSARIFFNANLFLLGFLLYLNWVYSSRKDLIKEEVLSKKEIIKREKICMVLPSLALISIVISFFIPIYSPVIYGLSPFLKKMIA